MTLMNNEENKIEVNNDEKFIIEEMRKSGPYTSFRIEKQNGKLVFITIEEKRKVVAC